MGVNELTLILFKDDISVNFMQNLTFKIDKIAHGISEKNKKGYKMYIMT